MMENSDKHQSPTFEPKVQEKEPAGKSYSLFKNPKLIKLILGSLFLVMLTAGILSYTVSSFILPRLNKKSSSDICIQVITSARNPKTNECKEFPTPCDVPEGWIKVDSCSQQPSF